jgi:TonB family protein
MRCVFLVSATVALAGSAGAQAGSAPAQVAAPSAAPARGTDTRVLFSADDYPPLALRNGEQGTAQAELTIGTDGRVKACKIVRSSNSVTLDTATCNILVARARFIPARDANGNAVEDTYVTPRIAWLLVGESGPGASEMKEMSRGHYLCSTAAGEFKQQELVALRPGQEMQLLFRLVEDHSSEEWAGLAAIVFVGPNGESRVAIGRAHDDRSRIFMAIATPGDEEQDVVFQYPLTSNWIALNLNLDTRGFLTVSSGSLKKRYRWGTVSRTCLHCNSGDWEIAVAPNSYVPSAPAPPAAVK